jgi:hypothetical protein
MDASTIIGASTVVGLGIQKHQPIASISGYRLKKTIFDRDK